MNRFVMFGTIRALTGNEKSEKDVLDDKITGLRIINMQSGVIVNLKSDADTARRYASKVGVADKNSSFECDNLSVINNGFIGTNGDLSRYPAYNSNFDVVANKNSCVVLERLENNDSLIGYRVIAPNCRVTRISVKDAVKYANEFQFANGKIHEVKPGSTVVAAIRGNFHIANSVDDGAGIFVMFPTVVSRKCSPSKDTKGGLCKVDMVQLGLESSNVDLLNKLTYELVSKNSAKLQDRLDAKGFNCEMVNVVSRVATVGSVAISLADFINIIKSGEVVLKHKDSIVVAVDDIDNGTETNCSIKYDADRKCYVVNDRAKDSEVAEFAHDVCAMINKAEAKA